jgi:hypothetical protein
LVLFELVEPIVPRSVLPASFKKRETIQPLSKLDSDSKELTFFQDFFYVTLDNNC